MNLKEIKEILKLLKETEVSEFELERANGKLKIRMNVPSLSPVTEAPSPTVKETPPALEEVVERVDENLKKITAPMVGTFYNAPSPNAPIFVEEGSKVKKGQVICIIEAMKLMNEVEAEFDCKIVSILAENAQPVEFGESLFGVEPL